MAEVHDAGSRRRGGQPARHLASAKPGWTPVQVEWKPSKKGTGITQPIVTHQHWHIDVPTIDIGGMFYYLLQRLILAQRDLSCPNTAKV